MDITAVSTLPRIPDSNFSATSIRAGATAFQASSDVTIVTADGDRVTISGDVSATRAAAVYDRYGRVEGEETALHAALSTSSLQSSFSITVEGDLSKQEQKEIKSALHALGKLFQKTMTHGEDSAPALAAARHLDKLERLDSLQQVSAEFTVSESFVSSAALELETEPADPEESGESQPVETAAALIPAAETRALFTYSSVGMLFENMKVESGLLLEA